MHAATCSCAHECRTPTCRSRFPDRSRKASLVSLARQVGTDVNALLDRLSPVRLVRPPRAGHCRRRGGGGPPCSCCCGRSASWRLRPCKERGGLSLWQLCRGEGDCLKVLLLLWEDRGLQVQGLGHTKVGVPWSHKGGGPLVTHTSAGQEEVGLRCCCCCCCC